jgi:membrane protein
MRSVFSLVGEIIDDWLSDGCARLAAALAYYTAFSIAPLLLLLTAVASPLYGEAQYGVLEPILRLIPGNGSQAVTEMLNALRDHHEHGTIATLMATIALVAGAAGVFGQLQDALNTVWNVEPKPNAPIVEILRRRFISLAMATTVFALIFKFVPDVRVRWRDAWLGGSVTACLFTIGQAALATYLGDAERISLYGAFASVIVFLLWVYYSAQILLLGAEFTQVYARGNAHARGKPRTARA